MSRVFGVLMMIFVLQTVKAQDDSVSKARIDGAYLKSYLLDSRDIVSAPFHPTTRRVVSYSVVAAGTAVLFCTDKQIRDFVQNNRTNSTDDASKYVFEPYGRGVYSGAILGGLYLQGLIWKNERSKRTAMTGVKALALASALIQIPKFICRRERPYQSPDDPHLWFRGLDNVSFASGHTCAAFAVSTVLAMEYKQTVWVPIVAYSLATCTGLSRINDDKHWASDVFVGAAIGYGVATLLYRTNNWKIKTTPIVGMNTLGLHMQW